MKKPSWSALWCVGALAVAVSVGGCAGNGKTKSKDGTDGNKTPAVAACDKHRAKVEKLYRSSITETDAKKRAAAEAAVTDNVDMIMTDCRTNPKRFAPCLARTTTVADMEKSCIIPLDDEGRVEGSAFGGR